MSRRRKRWSDIAAAVAAAGADLARAEYDVVSSELKSSGRVLRRSLVLLLFGLFALFWAVGALALVLVEIGSLWLPRWEAALAVLALFLLVGIAFAILAWRRMAAIEPPYSLVRRRLEEHRDWWERRIADGQRGHRSASRTAAEAEAESEGGG